MAAIALVAAACGDSGTARTTEAAQAPATTVAAPPTTLAPTPTAPPTTVAPTTTVAATTTTTQPATTTTTTTVPEDLALLEESLGEAIGDLFAVAPGVYAVETLGVPLRIDLQAFSPAVARINEGSFIALTLPEHGFFTHPVVFLVTESGLPEPGNAGVHDDESPASVPISGADDITAHLGGTAGIVLLDQGEHIIAGLPAPWWDFTTDAAAGGGFSCPFGTNCFNIIVVPGHGNFIAGEDHTYRLWRIGDGELYAFMQAPSDQRDYADELSAEFLSGVSL